MSKPALKESTNKMLKHKKEINEITFLLLLLKDKTNNKPNIINHTIPYKFLTQKIKLTKMIGMIILIIQSYLRFLYRIANNKTNNDENKYPAIAVKKELNQDVVNAYVRPSVFANRETETTLPFVNKDAIACPSSWIIVFNALKNFPIIGVNNNIKINSKENSFFSELPPPNAKSFFLVYII